MVIEGSGVQRLREKTRNLPKHKVPLPPELKVLGCDDALWSKIRAKDAFVRLIEAGDTAGAKERLENLRNAPSVTGQEMAMPAVLAEWGCDAELWSVIRSKKVLFNLARDPAAGEAEGRRRIARLRDAVAKEAARPPLPPKPKAPSTKESSSRGAGAAKPLSDYKLDGTPPAGVDVSVVEKMLAERVDAKKAKDYATADGLQEQLEGMGVYTNDRRRTWSGERPGKKLA